jgi:hypothetical protein
MLTSLSLPQPNCIIDYKRDDGKKVGELKKRPSELWNPSQMIPDIMQILPIFNF